MLWGTAVELLPGVAAASQSQTQASTLPLRSDINKIANLFSLYFHNKYEMAESFSFWWGLARIQSSNINIQTAKTRI